MPDNKSSSVEETHNGVKKEGDLDEIKDFAEEVSEAVQNTDVKKNSVEEFEKWRPREDDTEDEIKERTVEAATKPEKRLEESSDTIEDVKRATEKVSEAGEKIRKLETPQKELKQASKEATRPLISRIASIFLGIEKKVFSSLMIPLNGYYFDSEDMAVDMKDKNDGKFEMDVKVTGKEKKDSLKDQLSEK